MGTAFGIFAGGTFLSGYLVYLGASDLVVTYVQLIPSISGIFLVFLSSLVERSSGRKKTLLTLNFIGKIMISSVVLVPLFVPRAFQIPIIVFWLIVAQMLNGLNAIVFNSWFTTLVPQEIKGRYFSSRQIIAVIVSLILPFTAGKIMDSIPDPYAGYLTMFMCALLVGLMENFVFAKIDDVTLPVASKKTNILKAFSAPLHNKPFMTFNLIICLFHLIINVAGSFTFIYMRRYLGLSYAFINGVAIISSGLQILIFYKFWGLITDRMGANFSLLSSMLFYIFDIFLWVFVTDKSIVYLLPIIHVMAAVNGSGFAVGGFYRRYELIPENEKVTYDAFHSCSVGIVLLLAPTIGNFLRNKFAESSVITSVPFGQFRAVYLVSAVLLLILHIIHHRYAQKATLAETGKPLFQKGQGALVKRYLRESMPVRSIREYRPKK